MVSKEDKQLGLMMLAGAKRRLKVCNLCKKLAKSTHHESAQAKGLQRRIIIANIEAQELIKLARLMYGV